ncbi:hypothetical protein HFO56_33175 [Rhizobium laguerreae]|uniref:hypothetical protein n=1 Tax=Rhizobium laguerreae TaxID=1076926 RepID=UPI001C923717|nr:hypothetical protein [Rhizobium laguerreae]MBY3157178.1 hypothetical protein [Rhizobium laguerreae]MBY3432971.1 hypothetical protein [Rhizobium laguerreae]
MKMMMLDDRVLFPGQMLGGLARVVIARKLPDVTVHGLLSRGMANIGLAVSRNGVSFQLGVRFKIDRKGLAFVTTMHRRHRQSDGFGTMVDETKAIYHDEPSERIVLRTSSRAFRGFWETGLNGEWDAGKLAASRRKINEAIRVGDFSEAFIARLPDGKIISVPPLVDLTRQVTASAA